jgi:hypothetical protein
MRRTAAAILIPVALVSCGKVDLTIPYCEIAIFREAEYIWVPEYYYTDPFTNREYLFHGTSSDQKTGVVEDEEYERTYVIPYDHFDTVSSRPSFIWEETKSKYVMVAIFSERIDMDLQTNRIANEEAMVWAWNTGMSTGREGSIGYADGCSVIEGVIQYGTSPDPLENGASYILAIWGWDKSANYVRYSSREIPFTVEEIPK